MQSREEIYRKDRIEKLESLCRQTTEQNEIQFLNLKIQLLKGVDEPEEFKAANEAFCENQGDPELLAFLLSEGIFSNYKEFYQCREMDTLTLMSQTAGEYVDSVPSMGMWAGLFFFPAGFIGGIKGLVDANTREPLNQDRQIQLFCFLEKIRSPGLRNVFVQMVNTICEKKKFVLFPPRIVENELGEDVHESWLNILYYMAESKNNGTPLYCTVHAVANDQKGRQDRLGFRNIFAFFNKCDAFPREVHEIIREKFIALSQ